jgi:hypothetical protein
MDSGRKGDLERKAEREKGTGKR